MLDEKVHYISVFNTFDRKNILGFSKSSDTDSHWRVIVKIESRRPECKTQYIKYSRWLLCGNVCHFWIVF